jgi:hypothetical protein
LVTSNPDLGHGLHGEAMRSLPDRMGSRAERGYQQLIDDVVDPPFGDRLGHTASEVGLENVTADPIERTLHRRQLVEHVDAVAILVDHANHPIEMPARGT